MLTGVSLENFKCFEKIEIEDLSDIAILSGKNNVGKSAIIQAIVLIKESIGKGEFAWDTINLRSFKDAVYKHEDVDRNIRISFKFKLNDGNRKYLGQLFKPAEAFKEIKYTIEIKQTEIIRECFHTDKNELILSINWEPTKITLHASMFNAGPDIVLSSSGWSIRPFGFHFRKTDDTEREYEFVYQLYHMIESFFHRIYYLSPSRQIAGWTGNVKERPKDVGIYGYSTSALLHYIHSDRDDQYYEIENWLKEFDSEITMLKSPLERGESEIKLDTKITDVNIVTTGTGLKTVFPLVVQGLISPPNSIIIVEEPEIHLHRGGQKTLLKLLLELTKKGKQIIFTTHSWDIFVELYKMVKNGQITEDKVSRFDLRLEDRKRVAIPTPIFDDVHKKWVVSLHR